MKKNNATKCPQLLESILTVETRGAAVESLSRRVYPLLLTPPPLRDKIIKTVGDEFSGKMPLRENVMPSASYRR